MGGPCQPYIPGGVFEHTSYPKRVGPRYSVLFGPCLFCPTVRRSCGRAYLAGHGGLPQRTNNGDGWRLRGALGGCRCRGKHREPLNRRGRIVYVAVENHFSGPGSAPWRPLVKSFWLWGLLHGPRICIRTGRNSASPGGSSFNPRIDRVQHSGGRGRSTDGKLQLCL